MSQLQDKALILRISKKIKEIRTSNGVTLEEFYFDTGIHLARIESGKANVSVSTLSSICKYFNV